jgi:phosphoribosylanthranilate isomerase
MKHTPPKVKICGLTREEDVACAVACNVDFLGFVLYQKSPRFVSPNRLEALTRNVPPQIAKVGVVVNAEPALLQEALDAGGLQVIQFHGDETPDQLAAFRGALSWKALPLGDRADLDVAKGFAADMIVVDAAGGSTRGGTGRRCNWDLAAELAARRPIILAGGLSPDNVTDAVRAVTPFGVDVSSGVEQAPGRKDHDLIRSFVSAVRTALDAIQPYDTSTQG